MSAPTKPDAIFHPALPVGVTVTEASRESIDPFMQFVCQLAGTAIERRQGVSRECSIKIFARD
ncbi:hypothetical protein AGR3A_Cc170074 [Agrobacterium tomkonis CFBP 6623]|uniref:Uncharacterized protein n=1 Tax=Agrobacterium tomkonis CFBP 6623 TaxID=1183432 RepID=A0A1S7NUC9_9HYPH|nr:hypothetical protein AGR3A_Cc170074 [Agrobacterium tomkonis CFBP 6623]